MGTAYDLDWACSGRCPEREQLTPGIFHRPRACRRHAKIIQRQASNLRSPQLKTLFAIPPSDTVLHRLLQRPEIYTGLVALTPSSFEEFRRMLDNLEGKRIISPNLSREILQSPPDEILSAIRVVMIDPPTTYDDLILDEFRVLVDVSVRGNPPIQRSPPRSPTIFEVDPNRVKTFTGPAGNVLRVTPILKLETITVQISYRREVGEQLNQQLAAEPVDVSFTLPGNPEQRWYPGTEYLGEGIFIMFHNNQGWDFTLTGMSAAEWQRTYADLPAEYQPTSHIFRGSLHEEIHPIFVWWHTLSHLLIRSIAEESGYSSASIRERVYFESNSTRTRGAILLYATQPGSEGTMGGLISLVPHFEHILNVAIDRLQTCSGGPLCTENRFSAGKYNGAACASCVLVSETSCEHRNMWLDRNVILENMP